jgi:coenzyme F420-0:L-glutamate ligase
LRLYPIETKIIGVEDSLVDVLLTSIKKQKIQLDHGDVLAITSKIVAHVENRLVNLRDVKPSKEAEKLAAEFSLQPKFVELVLQEADEIYGGVCNAILTLKDGVLTANAGIDNKNTPRGKVALFPNNLLKWINSIRKAFQFKTGKKIAVLIVDSGLRPLRLGTTGFALAVAGFRPIKDYRGMKDLYQKPVVITQHAIADDLASAAHLLMRENAEKIPAVLIKNAPVVFEENVYDAKDMSISFQECLFSGTFFS